MPEARNPHDTLRASNQSETAPVRPALLAGEEAGQAGPVLDHASSGDRTDAVAVPIIVGPADLRTLEKYGGPAALGERLSERVEALGLDALLDELGLEPDDDPIATE